MAKHETKFKTRVKICCIQSVREAKTAIECGADAIGLLSKMPTPQGVISEELIAKIASRIPPFVTSVLLTSKTEVVKIIKQHKKCKTNAIQLCMPLKKTDYKKLAARLPGISLIGVVHVNCKGAISKALEIAPYVSAILLDSGKCHGKNKTLGGTGKTHNWNISKIIRQKTDKPVFLAGGLTPENVAQAVKKVKPFGVDVYNGVRTNKRLDKTKLKRFIEKAKG
jgi:phosphoribosylanthranilate isomerase